MTEGDILYSALVIQVIQCSNGLVRVIRTYQIPRHGSNGPAPG